MNHNKFSNSQLIKFEDKDGKEVILSEDSYNHILEKHPESESYIERINKVISDPCVVFQDTQDSNRLIYYRFEVDILIYLVVPVKYKSENYILSLYPTKKLKKLDIVWEHERHKHY